MIIVRPKEKKILFLSRSLLGQTQLTNKVIKHLYVWKLKDRETPHVVDWSIKARGHPFSSGGRACDLCLTEKLTILTADQNSMLNKRDELLEACRHQRKHLLVSLIKPPDEEEPPDTTIK